MKQRDSGIETLRIISMMMVVGIHAFLYGGLYESTAYTNTPTGEWSKFVWLLLRPAVNIFVMITGYFMARSAFNLRKSLKKCLSTYSIILFYSVVLTIITLLLGKEFYTINGQAEQLPSMLFRMIFPISSQQWYFFTSYLLLCLVAPFINIALQKLTKKQYGILVIILFAIFSVWIYLANCKPLNEYISARLYDSMLEGKNLISFIVLYIFGGYIGMHTKKRTRPNFIYLLLFFVFTFINYLLSTLEIEAVDLYTNSDRYVNPLIMLAAASMLMFFKDLHFTSKFVNILSSTMIGVYAIHEFKYIRYWLWSVFDFRKWDCTNTGINMLKLLGIILTVITVCALLDLIRQLLFKLFKMIFEKIR